MKKIYIIIMMMMLGAISAAAQTYENEGVIEVNLVNQDPDPVGPGEYVDIRWKVGNLGTKALSNIVFELVPSYPFSLDPGENAEKEISSLAGLQRGDSGYIIKYKVRVDENAVQGTNKIALRYKTDTSGWTKMEYDINVQAVDANLAITSIETYPETVLPGTTFDLKIKVRNMADSTIKDVSLKLDTLLSSIVVGAATGTTKSEILDAVPFAPLKSATEKKVRNIKPGEEVIFTYHLIAYPDAEAKVYKIPIEIRYFNGVGTEYSQDDVIGLVVSAEPDISVILDETEIKKPATKGDITITFVNKGLTNIQFLDVTLQESEMYNILSVNEVYIGNIDSDDYETVDYEIYVKQTSQEKIDIPIHYEYMDANNNKYSKDAVLKINLCGELDPSCNAENNYTALIIIAVLAAAVIGFFIIRSVMKNRKK